MDVKITKEYRFYFHNNYIKTIHILFIISWITPMLNFIFKSKSEALNPLYFIPTIVFSLIAIIIILRRRYILRKMLNVKLDFLKVYKIQNRRSKNNLYNLRLLMVISFFDGDFQESITYADAILSLTSKKKYIKYAIFYKIISCFLIGNIDNAVSLIRVQKDKTKIPYYSFIEAYCHEQYDEAITVMQMLLSKKKVKTKNIEKILANYFMRMAYLKKGDCGNAQNCIVEILVADKKRNTYFSKNARKLLIS